MACPEEEFYMNFLKWHYGLQSMLYYRILRANIDKDDYFRDFQILDYRFIFCNRDTLNPMVWEFKGTKGHGTQYFGRHKQIGLPDPEDLGKDLSLFLSFGQTCNKPELAPRNSLTNWINTL